MKVLNVGSIGANGFHYTILFLDQNKPSGKYNVVTCGEEQYNLAYLSGGRLDVVAIEGKYDLAGREISFETR